LRRSMVPKRRGTETRAPPDTHTCVVERGRQTKPHTRKERGNKHEDAA
jgi:hypothetical protein